MLTIIPISAFKDNYIWVLINTTNQHCAIVDPGDADPVIAYLHAENLIPDAILITHHHADHTDGILKLKKYYPTLSVYGPSKEAVAALDHPLSDQSVVKLPYLDLTLQVYDIPGHTLGHIAYYGNNSVFCGDTLFSAGCGRIFEGTPAQMYQSLQKIRGLPDATLIYCGHEYTAANLRFAEVVEPENNDIQIRKESVLKLREQNIPTLPSTLAIEKLTNPFLRVTTPSVIRSVQTQYAEIAADPVSIFQALRAWKDKF